MDKKISNLLKKETKRQNTSVNLIASENIASKKVLEALGSVFTDKYAEGYPGCRYYGGNEVIDEVENLAVERALKLFKLSSKKWHVNVQPYSGSPANLAVFFALVPLGKKIMGLRLDMGGHLTHGHKASVTGKLWRQTPYRLDEKTEKLDYEELKKVAKREKPAIVVAGFTAYSRKVNFKKFREIADAGGALLLADISHIAGLVATGVHPSPFPYADVVTTTTQKTLRGPRGAMIFSRKKPLGKNTRKKISKKDGISALIDKTVFPGVQGGPHMNQIAAMAVALGEAQKPAFKKYAEQIIKNAKCLAGALAEKGWRVVSGGTENHLMLIDVGERGISGKEAEKTLGKIGITVNKNFIPYDKRGPFDPSGIRLGTPAITSRGMKEKEMLKIADFIDKALTKTVALPKIKKEVEKMAEKFPTF